MHCWSLVESTVISEDGTQGQQGCLLTKKRISWRFFLIHKLLWEFKSLCCSYLWVFKMSFSIIFHWRKKRQSSTCRQVDYSSPLSCFSVKTMEITNVKNFQGVSKFDDKYEGKTLVKMDPSSQGGVLKMDQNKKVQHKMASWASLIYEILKKRSMKPKAFGRLFRGRGGIFLGDWKLHRVSAFWESLAQMASVVKI